MMESILLQIIRLIALMASGIHLRKTILRQMQVEDLC